MRLSTTLFLSVALAIAQVATSTPTPFNDVYVSAGKFSRIEDYGNHKNPKVPIIDIAKEPSTFPYFELDSNLPFLKRKKHYSSNELEKLLRSYNRLLARTSTHLMRNVGSCYRAHGSKKRSRCFSLLYTHLFARTTSDKSPSWYRRIQRYFTFPSELKRVIEDLDHARLKGIIDKAGDRQAGMVEKAKKQYTELRSNIKKRNDKHATKSDAKRKQGDLFSSIINTPGLSSAFSKFEHQINRAGQYHQLGADKFDKSAFKDAVKATKALVDNFFHALKDVSDEIKSESKSEDTEGLKETYKIIEMYEPKIKKLTLKWQSGLFKVE
ncbi:MAG: hypothetical protein DHS80DRAFT_28724 [Piptocephalis tieghemiana]|nr:MAG: hypothetical protein DHS80DRAFT_28724 [Piptocephalis tieghemiana]